MIFTAEYEFALRAIALTTIMTAWIFARLLSGQSVLHPWFGAMTVGLLSSIVACVGVGPGVGPVPSALAYAGALFTGMLFCAGVRFEATGAVLKPIIFSAMAVIAAVGALGLQLTARTPAMRILILHASVGLLTAASLFWLPRLIRTSSRSVGGALIGMLAIGILIDRVLPLAENLVTHGRPHWAFVFPYIARSDIFIIFACGFAMVFFSAERAHHRRVEASLKGA